MSITYVQGDLFEPAIKATEDHVVLIPHVVNDQAAFGAGFVVPLARRFPVAKTSYDAWYHNIKPPAEMLNFRIPEFELGKTMFVQADEEGEIVICHMLAQTLGGARPLYYNHLARCLDDVAAYAKQREAVIHAPAFGSGLAGGKWDFVAALINDSWLRQNLDVTIYYLPGTLPEVENESESI